jgi:hypothetical protein
MSIDPKNPLMTSSMARIDGKTESFAFMAFDRWPQRDR